MNIDSITMRRRQGGMTLVELMVTLVLSLFLMGGIIQIFVANRVTYAFNDGASRIQENARFSLDHMAFTARMAGHSGCIANVSVFNNLNAPNTFRDDITTGITGHNFNGTGVGQTFAAGAIDPAPAASVNSWSPVLPPDIVPLPIPGSDVLVVRSAAGPANSLVAPFSDGTQLFLPTGHGYANGELLVVADCQKASIFQLTSSGTSGTDATLVHATGGGFVPANSATTAPWPAEQDYGLGAEVSRLQTFAFYVGPGANGRPSLFQHTLQLTGTTVSVQPVELVEGVDTMQIRYGNDTDNDGDVDAWVTADAVTNWTQVLSIEVTLLARSTDEYGTETDAVVYNVAGTQFDPVDDRRFRQTFSSTIGLRNRLP